MSAPIIERFVAGRDPLDQACWEWSGYVMPNGYGNVKDRCHDGAWRTKTAHRAVYEALIGPIPDGMDLDHLCRNRRCCNPAHLEPVTRKENLDRSPRHGRYTGATHCIRGHEFNEQNTRTKHHRDGSLHRQCRTCQNDWNRAHMRTQRRAEKSVI